MLRNLRSWFQPLLQPVLSVAFGITAGLLVTMLAGESPVHVLTVLLKSSFGSWYDLGMTLFYSTPLIFTGLSVAFAFNAGLFNIGAEGQLTMGALAAAAVGCSLPNLPWPLAPVLAGVAAFAAGGAWGGAAGWLRARRGSHEVITTIMMNFIAAGLSSYVTLYLLKNPDSQSPETAPIGASYYISQFKLFDGAPVGFSLVIALIVAALVSFFLWKTVLGFEVRSVGQNEVAAKVAGIPSDKVWILSMLIAGGLAGLVGVGEVLGNSHKFKMGFSPGYGFIGIAVALLGRGKPLGVVASALLFGALHKGTADLDFETENVTRDISLILQAMVILSVSADGLWTWTQKSKSKKAGAV